MPNGPESSQFQFANCVTTISSATPTPAQIATAMATSLANLATNIAANTTVGANAYVKHTAQQTIGSNTYCIASTYPRRFYSDTTNLVGYDTDLDEHTLSWGSATAQSGTGESVGVGVVAPPAIA